MDFDYMMEGFQYESELKHKVIKMQVTVSPLNHANTSNQNDLDT